MEADISRKFKIGLALGGGAARAFSHIGVLAGLTRCGIPVDIVTGTSMGALIGAMYAVHKDVSAIKARFDSYINSEEFAESGFNFFKELDSHEEGILAEIGRLARRGVFNALMVTKTALVNDKTAAGSYAFLIEDIAVEQTRIPFAAVALDLCSGEAVVLSKGRLREAVAASCAMPGVLNPVVLDGWQLVDGGWVETVPIKAARQLGADFVIAVDVGGPVRSFVEPRNALDIIARADALARNALNKELVKTADIVLSPHSEVSHWADFSKSALAIDRGEEEVAREIGAVKRALIKARWKKLFGGGVARQ